MELRYYLRMLQRGWWIIAITALAALNVALISAYLATPIYQASARFVVSPNPELIKAADVLNSLDTLDKRSVVSTYAEFMQSSRIFQETSVALGLNADDLSSYEISAVVLPDANILELSVEGPDPQLTALLANSVGQRGIDYIKTYYQIYDINLLDPAAAPTEPTSPQPIRDAGLSLVLGAVVGVGLAILSEQIRIPLDAYRQRRNLDGASGAYNRRHFQHVLEDEVAQRPEGVLSLAMIQMNGLKDLIDTLPQPLMQPLLRQVATILRKELRGGDIVGRWDDLCFAILLPATPGTAAIRTLKRICQALSTPIILENGVFNANETLNLEPYVGVATYENNSSVQSLVERTTKALETALLQGRDKRGTQCPVVLAEEA
ncbi:MAG TPA: diguanylate cyclase [Anaerolineales bacterium]|nr:diguanylate cyclase [Anaerolineales bacterium]